jgi:hypothetical protein
MKTNELRIGNYVKYYYEVMSIDIPEYKIENGADIQVHENFNIFEPIPITEEWLLKFGFNKIGTNWEKGWLLLHTNLKTGTFDFLINEPYSGKMNATINQSVHQLQNLYFALTGEELTLKQ